MLSLALPPASIVGLSGIVNASVASCMTVNGSWLRAFLVGSSRVFVPYSGSVVSETCTFPNKPPNIMSISAIMHG